MKKSAKRLWEYEGSLNCLQNNKINEYGERSPSAGEQESRCAFIVESMTEILKELATPQFYKKLSPFFKGFVGLYFTNGNYLRDEYHFEFEISRLEFNIFGGLANMDPERTKMMVNYFILMHGLLAKILSKPWEHTDKYPDTPKRRLNLRIVCSLLYHFIDERFKGVKPVERTSAESASKTALKFEKHAFGKFTSTIGLAAPNSDFTRYQMQVKTL